MKNKYLAILIIFFIFGCNFPTRPNIYEMTTLQTQYNKKLFDIGNRGIVIVQVNNQNDLGNYFSISGKSINSNLSLENNKIKILMLPAGEYTFNNFYLYRVSGGGNYQVIQSENLRNFIKPISFVVKNNKVVYLGNISISTKKIDDRKIFEKFKSSITGNNYYKLAVNVKIDNSITKKQIGKIKKLINRDVEINLLKMEN